MPKTGNYKYDYIEDITPYNAPMYETTEERLNRLEREITALRLQQSEDTVALSNDIRKSCSVVLDTVVKMFKRLGGSK